MDRACDWWSHQIRLHQSSGLERVCAPCIVIACADESASRIEETTVLPRWHWVVALESRRWNPILNRRNLISIALGLVFYLSAVPVLAELDDDLHLLRSSINCGPNAILMFLVLCGVDPSTESIDSIPCGTEGASLLDLSKFAETYGVDTEVRHYQPFEFRDAPLPAICQTRGGRGSGLKHFVVAYDVDSVAVHALDATTGKYFRVRTQRIDDVLSGYVLVLKPSFATAFAKLQGWIFSAILIVIFLLLRETARHARVYGAKAGACL
jgi:hypothetical protein